MKTFALSAAFAMFAFSQTATQLHAQAAGGAAPMLNTNPVPFPDVGGLAKPSDQPPPGGPYGDVTVAGTGLAVTGGYSSRFVAEEAANVYYGNWGLHFDTSHDWREENADYVVGGVSYAVTPYVRPKILFGTSSENLGIQPQAYFRGEIEFQSPGSAGSAGIVAISSITYREYRNGVKETVPEMDIAFYLPEFSNHNYIVMEAKALATFVAGVSGVGYETSGSATLGCRNGAPSARRFSAAAWFTTIRSASLCVRW